jgi:hypothetical protein
MCAEAITILRAVAADFFFNCWCLEIPSEPYSAHTNVRPLSCATLSIGNVLEFLCWKWKPYPKVVFRKSRLVSVMFYISDVCCLCRVLTCVRVSREIRVRVPIGPRIFNSPCLPDRLWDPPSPLSK